MQDQADPKAIARGWIETMYSEPPDLVWDSETGFPAAQDGAVSGLMVDPVPLEPNPAEDDWRAEFKRWFDAQP